MRKPAVPLLLALLGSCAGGGDVAVSTPAFSEDEWLRREAGATSGWEWIEGAAVLAEKVFKRPISTVEARRSWEAARRAGAERFAATADPAARIGIANELIFGSQGLESREEFRWLKQALGGRTGDCVPNALLFVSLASVLDVPHEIVLLPGHVFLRCRVSNGHRNVEPTDKGRHHALDAYVEFLSKNPDWKGVFPEDPEARKAYFATIGPRRLKLVLLLQRSATLIDAGRNREGWEDVARAQALDPEWYFPWQAAANYAAFYREDMAAAERYLTGAIERDAGHPNLYRNRGVAYEKQGKLDRALKEYRAAIRLAPHSALLRFSEGNCLRVMKRYPESLEAYDRAVELDPGYEDARSAIAQVCQFFTKDHARAIREYTTLIARHPDKPLYRHNRAACYVNTKAPAKALPDLDEAIRLDPREGVYWRDRGAAKANLGRLEPAIEDLTRAIRLNPDDAKAYRMRAKVHQMAGRLDEAGADLERVRRIEGRGR